MGGQWMGVLGSGVPVLAGTVCGPRTDEGGWLDVCDALAIAITEGGGQFAGSPQGLPLAIMTYFEN